MDPTALPPNSLPPSPSANGFWGAFGAALIFLGKWGFDKIPRKPKGPSINIHAMLQEIQTAQANISAMQHDQEQQLIRMEERQVTKDFFSERIDTVKENLMEKVEGVHVRINDHIRDSHSKAA